MDKTFTQQDIIEFLSGDPTPEEQQAMTNWCQQDSAHQQLFDETQKLWQVTGVSEQTPDFEASEAWNKVSNQMKDNHEQHVAQIQPLYQKSWFKVAATIIIMIGLAWTLYQTTQEQPVVMITAVAEEGAKEVELSDGSVVLLNQGSALTYPSQFEGNTRDVELQGEAFFEVTGDTANPFTIYSGDFRTFVVGTSFNVKAYEKDSQITVTVVSGVVGVGYKEPELSRKVAFLNPGYRAIYTKSSRVINAQENQNKNFLSWKTKEMVFKNQPLSEVLVLLEQVYGEDIQVSSERINTCLLSADFKQQTLQEVLDVIALTLDLTVEQQEQEGYQLVGEGCQ